MTTGRAKTRTWQALAVGLAMSSQAVILAPPAVAQSASQAQTYAFIFKDADVGLVVEEILGNSLRVSYRVEPGVTGKINFRIEQRLTRAQLLVALEAALASYDIVMAQEGETIVLKPRAKAQIGGSIATRDTGMAKIGFQVRAVPVNYGSATEIAKVLETVSKAELVLLASDKLSLILLGGRADELETALSTIELFDQSTLSDARIRYFPLANSSAATVAADLEKILKESSTSSVTIAPMKRLNGLFAFSKSKEALDQLTPWVQKLDIPSNDAAIRVWVYHPKGASAESLVRTLNAVIGLPQSSESTTVTAEGSADTTSTQTINTTQTAANYSDNMDSVPRITADKDTNSVIINAPDSLRMRIQSVLNEIDREPAQVAIEASILEVTLNNEFNMGVDWSGISDGGRFTGSAFSGEPTNFRLWHRALRSTTSTPISRRPCAP